MTGREKGRQDAELTLLDPHRVGLTGYRTGRKQDWHGGRLAEGQDWQRDRIGREA